MFAPFRRVVAFAALAAGFLGSAIASADGDTPNILFITLDDMNWDSVGAYGCPIPGISPNIDGLAEQGMRFEYAFNQTASCVPSRTTYQTGRYPHVNGMLSFYNVDFKLATLPELLREAGYATGVVNKVTDSSINEDYEKYWDYYHVMKGPEKRAAHAYADSLGAFFDQVEPSGKPFYCVVNIADPHKPFYNDEGSIKLGFDAFKPSREYALEDVEIPPFLPEHPRIQRQVRNYYNSVKRGDDCVGAVLAALAARGREQDTLVVLISDHGMPLPFAKSSLYPNGTRTPLIVRWPGRVEGGSVESELMVSAIDFMPTMLEAAGLPALDRLPGRSFLPTLKGEPQQGPEFVFTEFNDISGGYPFPMRAVYTKTHAYIFNAWANGESQFRSAATTHATEKTLKLMATEGGPAAERYDFLIHRTLEEFYDWQADPHALNNLNEAPEQAAERDRLRAALVSWMEETGDYVLKAYEMRDEPEQLRAWMAAVDADALERAKTLQWKRHANRAGGTGKNKLLYPAKQ